MSHVEFGREPYALTARWECNPLPLAGSLEMMRRVLEETGLRYFGVPRQFQERSASGTRTGLHASPAELFVTDNGRNAGVQIVPIVKSFFDVPAFAYRWYRQTASYVNPKAELEFLAHFMAIEFADPLHAPTPSGLQSESGLLLKISDRRAR